MPVNQECKKKLFPVRVLKNCEYVSETKRVKVFGQYRFG